MTGVRDGDRCKEFLKGEKLDLCVAQAGENLEMMLRMREELLMKM